MCSISGFVVTDPLADRQRIAAHYVAILERGSDRGRDSAGVVSLTDRGQVRRRVEIAPQSYSFVFDVMTSRCSLLIGNNRAEPTTEFVPNKTQEDAQPFGDGTIFVSHNGIIANDNELRAEHGIETNTPIDSAVCPSLFRHLGVYSGLKQLQGSFALAIIDARRPHRLWLARNYKPLFLQSNPTLGALFFASRSEHLGSAEDFSERLRQPAILPVPSYHLLEVDGQTEDICERELAPRGQRKRALVICSGGLDSTTAAAWAQLQGYHITLLHFLYNCRAQEREVEAIYSIAQELGCDYRFEEVSWLGELGGSSLTDVSMPITDNETSAEYAHEWVPARNLVFCALAASLCDRYGYDTLIMGLNLEESGAYPDNTVEFYEALDHVCDIGTMSRPRILSPLGHLVKHQIVQLALDIGAPIHLSWSCYYGGTAHCGHCGPCYMRRTAFDMLGVEDPVDYES